MKLSLLCHRHNSKKCNGPQMAGNVTVKGKQNNNGNVKTSSNESTIALIV